MATNKRYGLSYEDFDHHTYKYRLTKNYFVLTNISARHVATPVATPVELPPWLTLWYDGSLDIKEGYSWDGPSGLTIDTPDFMRGSLVHDVLYQLMREKKLALDFRKAADKELYRLCREDGMPWWRATYVYYAVRWFGEQYATPAT